MRLTAISGLAAVSLLAAIGSALAFHGGGVGRCDGCHITHDGTPALDGRLLLAESASDTCLLCHETGPVSVMAVDPLLPGPETGAGNFVFLFEENLNDAPGGETDPIPGAAAGHSIVAPARGLGADSRNSVAPGGTFPSSELGCTSCHDPHGSNAFRMLYGATEVQQGLTAFAFPAPIVEATASTTEESQTNHNAYRSGVSDWCGNCHGRYHDSDLTGFEHPTDESFGSGFASHYNNYNGDDQPGTGLYATAYLPEVPFEDPSGTVTTGSTTGATTSSRVMCLSCHRAHASSSPHAGRWDFNVSVLEQDGVVSQSYAIPNPYPSPTQGPLCAKCHAGGTSSRAPVFDATRGLRTPRSRTAPARR